MAAWRNRQANGGGSESHQMKTKKIKRENNSEMKGIMAAAWRGVAKAASSASWRRNSTAAIAAWRNIGVMALAALARQMARKMKQTRLAAENGSGKKRSAAAASAAIEGSSSANQYHQRRQWRHRNGESNRKRNGVWLAEKRGNRVITQQSK